ncbi:hypothetical protein ACN4EE_07150 [Geminocystis sp. CENA526]
MRNFRSYIDSFCIYYVALAGKEKDRSSHQKNNGFQNFGVSLNRQSEN